MAVFLLMKVAGTFPPEGLPALSGDLSGMAEGAETGMENGWDGAVNPDGLLWIFYELYCKSCRRILLDYVCDFF